MRVKTIKIFGFKSFADKTILNFHPGITAIVGPNGCGKSNISDAFRWLFGEQSAKSMRGDKMIDVIFAGTTKRKPLNFAEVSVTFTEVEGHLPVDYAEVEVMRRLHRSGESEYFLNGQRVRQKDVVDLFLDTGVGKNSFAFFEQGKIDQVIQYTPLERRTIFEEAAGILRFLQRKREAFKKLTHVEANISRVFDIHQEVEKQIAVLEKQAEKAHAYQEMRKERDCLERGVFAAKWQKLNKRQEKAEAKAEEQSCLLSEESARLEGLMGKRTSAQETLEEMHRALHEKNDRVYQTKSARAVLQKERHQQEMRLTEIQEKQKRWQQEIAQMASKREAWCRELRALEEELIEKDAQKTARQHALETARNAVQEEENLLTALHDRQRRVQQEHLQLVQTEKQGESNLKQGALRLEHNRERHKQLVLRQESLKETFEETEQLIAIQKKESGLFQQNVEQKRGALSEVERRLDGLTKEVHVTQNSVHETHKKLAEAKAREGVLLRLREEKQGFSKGSKFLLKNLPVKPLCEVLSIAQDASISVMRAYSQTLVVETLEQLEEVLAVAKEKELKDISLICQELLETTLEEHFLGRVALEEDAKSALSHVQKNTGASAWTKEDLFVDSNRVLFYRTQAENYVFLREAELKKLSQSIRKLEKQKEQEERTFDQLQQKRAKISEEKRELSEELRSLEMQAVEGNFSLQRLEGDLIKIETERAKIAKESTELMGAMEELKCLIADLEIIHSTAKEQAQKTQVLFAGLEEELVQKRKTLASAREALVDKENQMRTFQEEQGKVQHARNVLEVKLAESHEQEKRLEEEIQQGIAMQNTLIQQDAQYAEDLKCVESQLEEMLATLKCFESAVEEKRSEIQQIEKQTEEKREQLKALEEQGYQVRVDLAQVSSSKEAIELEVQDRYQLQVGEIEEVLEMSIEQAERKVRALRREMEEAGAINMTSIEAFEEHKERYQHLQQQIEDLNASKEELVNIISQLDSQSRKVFKETFEKIRENFQKNFKTLFNGGEADLQFTESQDILEAGIEIIAKPPSKQMQSIQLLSGGEKCMTAIALLFAIFEVKSAPFCILDEIDAPLDDANVERFNAMVQEFVDRSQFIMITHNKGTMASANRLFGVSMEERGVSRLLAMEFAQDDVLVETV